VRNALIRYAGRAFSSKCERVEWAFIRDLIMFDMIVTSLLLSAFLRAAISADISFLG
jgi:hypothetical protein